MKKAVGWFAIVYGLGLSIYFGSWALRDNAALEVAVQADIPARELRHLINVFSQGVLAYCSKQFGMNVFGQPHTWHDVLDTKNSIELNLKYVTDQYTKKSTHATYEYLYQQELIKRYNCLTAI